VRSQLKQINANRTTALRIQLRPHHDLVVPGSFKFQN
jgi:hypothetical protein